MSLICGTWNGKQQMNKQDKHTKTHRHGQQYCGYQKGSGGDRKGGQVSGDRRTLDSGWRAHNATCRWRVIELHTWNLRNCVKQCLPNQFHLKKGYNIPLAMEVSPLAAGKAGMPSNWSQAEAVCCRRHVSGKAGCPRISGAFVSNSEFWTSPLIQRIEMSRSVNAYKNMRGRRGSRRITSNPLHQPLGRFLRIKESACNAVWGWEFTVFKRYTFSL